MPPPNPLWLRNARIALVAVIVGAVAVAQHFGLFALASDPARLKQTIIDSGPAGQMAFVLAYGFLQPFGVPGTVFVFVAPLIWPWPLAFALSMAGTMLCSVIGFSLARFVARDWLSQHIPARFAAYNEALARNGFWTVVLLRLLFWMPQILHTFLGVSSVGFWTHFWGSLVGYTPVLLATAYFGEQVVAILQDAPPQVWGTLAVVVALALAGWMLWRRKRLALTAKT